MIYNLSKFISDGTPYTPITNGLDPSIVGENVFLTQNGGSDLSRGLKVDFTVQIMVKSESRTKSFQMVSDVDAFLKNRFKVQLPAVTVMGRDYPEVIAERITPIQTPAYIGADKNGLHMWSVNYQVTTGE